eukprot:1689358-Amphidinium_carterae.1
MERFRNMIQYPLTCDMFVLFVFATQCGSQKRLFGRLPTFPNQPPMHGAQKVDAWTRLHVVSSVDAQICSLSPIDSGRLAVWCLWGGAYRKLWQMLGL